LADGNGNAQTSSTVLTLAITFDQTTGQVGVNGPIQNPLLCMGMMEMAKNAIHKFADETAKGQRIVPATALPFIKH
jgi:hypothetical protein